MRAAGLARSGVDRTSVEEARQLRARHADRRSPVEVAALEDQLLPDRF
jgi:hypothetical protein